MLVTSLIDNEEQPFSLYRNLEFEKEVNKLTKLTFEIPKEYRHVFQAECLVSHDDKLYEVKNIEPFYDGYKIECRRAIYTIQAIFLKNKNFVHKNFETIIKGVLPSHWDYEIIGKIDGLRTITIDHMDLWEAINLIVKKFDCEFKVDVQKWLFTFGKELGEDKGVCFFDDLNVNDKDITEESFEFATRIIPEGMNGLKINQINNGLEYLEDNSYCFKTITYYWKDERYTNIQNLKRDAEEKLKALSRPRITIKLKVKDLSDAIGVKGQKYEVGDYVYLIDRDRKVKERYRIISGKFYPYKPFDNDLILANKPLDMVDDLEETIELTNEMWEETRVRFETTDEAIEASVATSRRYTDDSFKTYKSERKQTDSQIYESITEATTYVDPKTGQTKPIIDKQLEIDKTVEGINISLISQANEIVKRQNEINDVKNIIDKLDEKYPTITDLYQATEDFNKKILSTETNFNIKNDEIKSSITSLSTSTNQKIRGLEDELNSVVPLGTKRFIEKNYATISQTDSKIVSSVSKVKAEVDEEFREVRGLISQTNSTIEQTNENIRTEVSKQMPDVSEIEKSANLAITVAADAAREAKSKVSLTEYKSYINQTAEKIEGKVSRGDVYSLIEQMPSTVKIKARNIDLTGNVSVVGDFMTASYGKRVYIEGSEIKFYNSYGSFIGKIGIDTDSSLNIQGSYSQDSFISMNASRYMSYTNFSGKTLDSYLFGDWGATGFYTFGLVTKYLRADQQIETFGDIIAHKTIKLGDSTYIKLTSNGNQMWIGRTYDSYDFVIDFNKKSTFWA